MAKQKQVKTLGRKIKYTPLVLSLKIKVETLKKYNVVVL